MEWVHILGFALIGTPLFMMLPQIIHTIKTKDINGLSLSSQMSWTASWILWALYGLTINSIPIFISNVIAVIADAILLVFIIHYTLKEHSMKQALKREGSHIFVLFTILPVVIMYMAFGIEPAILSLAIADFIALMPQLIKSFKSKSLSGLNPLAWWAKIAVNSGWIIYGFGIGNILSISWAFFMIPIYITILIRIYYDRVKHKEASIVSEEIHDVELHSHN